MGVAGSGKSTLGEALAEQLQWDFLDADAFHSVENIAKMSAGIPLTDADRFPWLDALNHHLLFMLADGQHPVLACSALKEKYRTRLLAGLDGIDVIYLEGGYELIRSRLLARGSHYMKENMLQSQFDVLEEPEVAVVLDISMPLDQMLETILRRYPSLERSIK